MAVYRRLAAVSVGLSVLWMSLACAANLSASGPSVSGVPLTAEQAVLAGGCESGGERVYIATAGAICRTSLHEHRFEQWAGPVTEVTDAAINASLMGFDRAFEIDRTPWVEGEVEYLGLDGKVWRRIAGADQVQIDAFGAWSRVNTDSDAVGRDGCTLR